MAKKPNKAIIVGIDAPIVPRLYQYCKEGHLPTINRLFLEQGTWAKNCLVPLPTITPPNWSAIATGASPSTLHITDFNIHVPGDELDDWHQGLFSDDVQAETIYEALAGVGKKSILLNYVCSWPPKVEDSIVIGGAHLSINEWARRVPLVVKVVGGVMQAVERASDVTYSGPGLYSTEQYYEGTIIKFEESSDWKNVSGSSKAMAAEMPLKFTSYMYQMEPVTWHVLVQDGRAMVCESKDTATAIATLGEGEWSPVITREFQTEAGLKKAVFRMKLLKLSPDVQKFRLYITNIAAADGWTHPASIATEIKSEEGLPGPGSPWHMLHDGWFNLDTVVEIEHIGHMFFADAATYLLKNKPWNLYMMHAHTADHMYHAISNELDNPDPAERKPFEEAELAVYKSLDEMCARIFACADDETIMAIVSDHGAKPTSGRFAPNRILQQAGLLTRDRNGKVDWSKTRAVTERSLHVYINLKGRDPHGIVEPGEEYRKVQEEVISVLYNYTDPDTGKKPFTLALKKEDARMIGMHGDWVGDVVFGVGGHIGQQHGLQVPTATYGIGDMHGLFALSGPNIRKGVELERTVWIMDLIPTICYLTGWPVPAQAEGAVIYQALKNPNRR